VPSSGPIACVVHFCTTKPGWVAQNPELFEYQTPALLIEGKVDEVAQGAADTALTYADPVRSLEIHLARVKRLTSKHLPKMSPD